MKNYITTALILVTGLAVSQNKPTDKITTTQTKIVKAKDGNTTYDKKVKVITTKEQEVKLDPKDKGKIDGDRVFTPTKVTKTILVDNDKDPFYDELTKVKYYKHNGNKYAFEKTGYDVPLKLKDMDNKLEFPEDYNEAEIDEEDEEEDDFDCGNDVQHKVVLINNALSQLPEGYRAVLSLYLFEGYDHEEISQVLGISESTSRTQFMRGKKKLLELISVV